MCRKGAWTELAVPVTSLDFDSTWDARIYKLYYESVEVTAMSFDLTMNATNSIPAGTVIYEKGEPLQSIALVLKGRVTLQKDGVRTVLGSGNFLGITDVEANEHSFTYKTLDDSVLYGLPVTSIEQVCDLLDDKAQYRGLLVTSLNFFLLDLYKIFQKLKKEEKIIEDFVKEFYENYKKYAGESGLISDSIPMLERTSKVAEAPVNLPAKLEYFIQCCRIQVEAQRGFFAANAYVAKAHFREQSQIFSTLFDGCRNYAEQILRYFRCMIMDEKNLFSLTGKMALNIKKAGQDDSGLSGMLDKLLEKINETETLLTETAGISPNLDRNRMEEVYFSLLSDDTGSLEAFEKEDLSVLNGSLTQIVEYAPIHMKVVGEFKEAMEDFLGLSDKFARTPEATAIRKKLSKNFFEIYEAVVCKSFEDANPPLAVKLFLRYGFVSEELLTEKELRTLISLPEIDNETLECKVYTLPKWLEAIYKCEKNPSKDEFDMDYEAHLRQHITEGKLEKTKLAEEFKKPRERLHFEIDNMVRYADRLLNGNISAFVPVLCSEGMFNAMEKAVVTGAAINTAVRKVEKVDYSIFYREVQTSYEKIDVTHFTLIDRFVPDFILFPVYGRCGLMWQDMEGRKKQTHARILLPSLIEQDLEQDILRLLSQFRWEKCRSEMGAQWNNYRYPSLTSEYTDYLQFYKKNNDLSPDRKEKVKAQLQQCNNRHRDVFARDYQDWIMREAAGAMRLNKVVRSIMFTYCPISPEIAEGLLVQNAYQEAARRYMTERRKQEKSVANTIYRFEKNNMAVPEELERTKKYLLDA